MKTLTTGRDFGKAVCEHLGLDPAKVRADLKLCTRHDEIVSVTMTVELSADDLAGIADHMPGRTVTF